MNARRPYNYRRKYRPLDVRSWFEGFLRLIGWILVILLSVISGGLFILYETKILNFHDTDFRDIYFDQRITNYANNRYHKHFLLAEQCCNPDPVFYNASCTVKFPSLALAPLVLPPWPEYMLNCKPLIMLECADIRSAACNATRTVLYNAGGLSAVPGTPYTCCLRAGRVRLGAEQVAWGRPITLAAYLYDPSVVYDTMVISNPFDINATQVQAFVDKVAKAVDPTTVAYVQPNAPLSKGIVLAGAPVSAALGLSSWGARARRAPPPWNVVNNLWPWPGMNARCQNTAVNEAWHIVGTAYITIPRFSLVQPQGAVVWLTVGNASIPISAWKVTPVDAGSDELGGSKNVNVSYLSSVQVAVGMVPMLGPCSGWQFSRDPNDLLLTYTTHWTGSVAALRAGTAFGPFVNQIVNVTVTDVGAPRQIALPQYGGMWYIVFTFGMAAIWMFGTALILLIIILVWWNIRSNKGLPPIVYRYMQKYRGW